MSLKTQESNIEELLQNGFETIVQAFELKKISSDNLLKEKEDIINDLSNKMKILNKENELLKKENDLLTIENNKLKQENLVYKSSIHSNSKSVFQLQRSIIIPKIKQIFDTNENENTITIDKNIFFNKEQLDENMKNGSLTDRKEINLDNNKIYINKNEDNLSTKFDRKKSSFSPGINEIRIPLTNINTNLSFNKKNNDNNLKYNKIDTKINTLRRNLSSKLFMRNLENHKTDIDYSQPDSFDMVTKRKNMIELNNNNVHQFQIFEKKIENINKNKSTIDEKNNQNSKKYFNNFIYNTKIPDNILNNGRRNENITKFLNQCKVYLTPRNFECIVNIFQKFKNGYINQETVISETKNLLQNNRNLIQFFESMFIVQ
jgi:hypothetical protein